MRKIVLDTETTGLDPNQGHRIVEIGCLELLNYVPTERTFHTYLNPERDIPMEAYQIHKLSETFLTGFPVFADQADEFLRFIDDSELVIHNAGFDMKFINAELQACGRSIISLDRTIDTVQLARRKFPGAQVSLDALCRRFEIDDSERTVHGALLDAKLLASVYLELIGGREPGFDLTAVRPAKAPSIQCSRARRTPRPHQPTAAEAQAHAVFIQDLINPIWYDIELPS